jgi:hypothetical protein
MTTPKEPEKPWLVDACLITCVIRQMPLTYMTRPVFLQPALNVAVPFGIHLDAEVRTSLFFMAILQVVPIPAIGSKTKFAFIGIMRINCSACLSGTSRPHG